MKWFVVEEAGQIALIAYAIEFDEPQIPKHFEDAISYVAQRFELEVIKEQIAYGVPLLL